MVEKPMKEVVLGYEPSSELVHIFHGLSFAYTDAQRKWILKRDGGEPQMRGYSEDKGWYNNREDYCEIPNDPCPHPEVNHLVNQADGGEDTPWNGITLGKCQHVGVCPSGHIKEQIALKRGLKHGR